MNKKDNNKNWFLETFNQKGELYEDYLGKFPIERTNKEVNFVIKSLNLKKGMNILDIPCGSGRHSIFLAKKEINVIGVDISNFMISEAKKRLLKEEKNLSIIFKKGDLRTFKSNKKFDAVINLGNSFGYFSDKENELVIKNIRKLIKKDGFFVLDISNTAGMLRNLKEKSKNQIKNKKFIIEEESFFDALSMKKYLHWKIKEKGKKGKNLKAVLRLYTFPEVNKLLTDNKFKITKIFGSFSHAPYSLESPRLIIISRAI